MCDYVFQTNILCTALCVCCEMFSPVGDPCLLQAPCENGGTCSNPAVGEFTCVCPAEWAGEKCDMGNHQFSCFVIKTLFKIVCGISVYSDSLYVSACSRFIRQQSVMS